MLKDYQRNDQHFDSTILPTGAFTKPLNFSSSQTKPIALRKHPPAVALVARPGTGKTTLVTKLIEELKSRGYRVGAVKHGPPDFEIDHPGKDSHRFTQAGTDNMLIASDNKLAFIKKQQQIPPLEELLTDYFPDVDIILVEGFKYTNLPKIEIHRHEKGAALLCRGDNYYDSSLLAVATDDNLLVDVPRLGLNNPGEVVDFLLSSFAIL